jgi:CheY-like chemotaxis protein
LRFWAALPQILYYNLEIFERRLAANNYENITATDGEAGLAVSSQHQPDLILLDIVASGLIRRAYSPEF